MLANTLLLILLLCIEPTLDSDGLSDWWIGYTEGRNDLPEGQFANWSTQRACVVRADGTDRKQIAVELATDPHEWTQFAGWSPDGSQAIVSSLWEDPQNALWEREHKTFRMTEGWLVDACLVDFASDRTKNLTHSDRVSIYNSGLFFLPNQRGYGFTALINGVSKPFVMDLAGGNKRDVSGGGQGFSYGYSASPDGKYICYHEDYQIYISDLDGANKRKVETGKPFNFVPQWSPDGQWLLFASGEHYDCHPTVVRADGGSPIKIGDRQGYRGVVEKLKHPDFHSESSDVPVWSADGKSVYYTAQFDSSVELMRVAIPTDPKTPSQPERLTYSTTKTRHYHPSPSPNGRWILFGSDRSGVMQLYVADADGKNARPVTDVAPGHAAMHGFWRPKL
jgi:Tol biopolymer transport system component